MIKITLSTSLQSLHYRIVNRILPTNTFLLRAGLTDSNLCTFCNVALETLDHLFMNCGKVREFISKIKSMLLQKYKFHITSEQINCVFPDDNERTVIGLISIIAIQCIWFSKLGQRELEVRRFESVLRSHYSIERYIGQMNNKYEQWHLKWDEHKVIC